MAVAGEDYCIVAADTRMSTGFNIMTRDCKKIVELCVPLFLSPAQLAPRVVSVQRLTCARRAQVRPLRDRLARFLGRRGDAAEAPARAPRHVPAQPRAPDVVPRYGAGARARIWAAGARKRRWWLTPPRGRRSC